MEQESAVNIIFQEIHTDGKVKLYETTIPFTPFMHKNLQDIANKLGLIITKDTYDPKKDWYYLYAIKIKS